MRTRAARWALLAAFALLAFPVAASADSGSATNMVRVSRTEWKVDLSVTHDCDAGRYCGYFANAYQAAAGVPCPADEPNEFGDDAIWTNNLSTDGTPQSATVVFAPDHGPAVRICLYVEDEPGAVGEQVFDLAATTPPPPADTPDPRFRVTSRTLRADGVQVITAERDACFGFDEGRDAQLWQYTDDTSCGVRARLRLVRDGRPYGPLRPFTSGRFRLPWACGRAGAYRWTATYENPSVPGRSRTSPFRTVLRGAFRVPPCRPPAPRLVGRGTASARAYSVNEDNYEYEFISSVRCSPTSGRSRASTWTCRTTHNNVYRECVDTDVLHFIRADRYGRRKIDFTVRTTGKRCRYY